MTASSQTALEALSEKQLKILVFVLEYSGLTVADAKGFADVLIDVRSELWKATASKRLTKHKHWLCELLANAADAVDSDVLAGAAGAACEDILIAQGMPQIAAVIAGKAIAQAAAGAASTLMPYQQLCLGLRFLGLMLCPDSDNCPEDQRLLTPVLQAVVAEPSSTSP